MKNTDITIDFGQFHFTFDRVYDHEKQSEASGLLGNGWRTRKIPRVFQDENGNYTLEFSKTGNVVFRFDSTSQQYVNIKKSHETLMIDTNANEYVFNRFDGTTWYFNIEATVDVPAGNLIRIDRGTDAPIVFEYDSLRLSAIESYRSETHDVLDATLHFLHDSAGRVVSMTHKTIDLANQLVDFERIVYVYYGENETHGGVGDLKTVAHSIGSEDAWQEIGTEYYRYYKDGDDHGQAHDMKMAFGPEDFDRLKTEFGNNVFSTADANALPFSSRFFQCDNEHRVVHEIAFHNTYAVSRTFETYAGPDDRNAARRKIVETRPDDVMATVFLNDKDKTIFHEEARAVGGQTDFVRHYTVFDRGGNVLKTYEPESLLGYSLVDQNGGKFIDVQVSSDQGKITSYSLLSSEEKAQRTESNIRKGSNGTMIPLRKWNYTHHTSGSHSEPRLSSEIVYPSDDGSMPIETTFEYELHPNSANVRMKTTRLPLVATSENGTGQQATTVEIYDIDERPLWTKDESGIISRFEYDPSGRLVRQIADVDTLRTTNIPAGWTTVAGAGKHLVTEYEYDYRGRLLKVVRPENSAIGENGTAVRSRGVTWTVHDDANRKTLSASGYEVLDENGDVASTVLANPVSMTVRDAYGNVTDHVQAARQSTAGPLTPTDVYPQSTWISWTKNIYHFGKRIASREYFLLPGSGDGVKDVHYAETSYEYDVRGRNDKTISPIGTISKVVFDDRGNVTEQWVGTNDNDMVVVGESVYGHAEGCATCGGGSGAQLLTQIQHIDDQTIRATEYNYDWRGRHTHTLGEQDAEQRLVYTAYTYDNLDRVVKSEQFLVQEPADRLLARTEQFYDVRGRVWKTEQSVVDPASGTVQGKLASLSWFDERGRQIKSKNGGENYFTHWEYDSLGRNVAQRTKLGNETLQMRETVYDNVGNAITSIDSEKKVDSSALFSRYTGAWFDPVGRQLAVGDYGYCDNAISPVRSYIPVTSDTLHVTKTVYDPVTGRAVGSVDPAGRVSRVEFDARGRVVRSVANVVENGGVGQASHDQNVTVETAYTPDGQVASLTAKNSVTGDQVTTYEYDGLGRLVREVYPDAENSGENFLDDAVEYRYNRLGEVVWKRDQNGTVHSYDYDDRGRLLADHVSVLGDGVDGTVRKIATAFNDTGNVETITSLDGNGAAVNQIRYVYGSNGLLRWEFTAHDGEVDLGTTPYTEYRYGTISGGMKPIGMKYPGGKELSYSYDTAGRVIAISEGAATGGDGSSSSDDGSPAGDNDVLVRYGWQGLGSAMKVEYVKPGLTLDYTAPGALDRFGRIADHRWENGDNDDIVRIQHGYDVTGNRMNRQDVVTPSWSETYGYDEMSQIATMNRVGHSESWQYDPTGNWMSYSKNNVVENRTHNAANEILNTVVHDANGNMTRMPSPKDGTTLDCVYDAWNRMVGVGENIRYEYDGRNHRIKKTVAGVVTKSFFNHGWQEFESRTGEVVTTYVWGLRYIDDLVLRERGNEKLYSIADPNWNVAAICLENGEIAERYNYDAFGRRDIHFPVVSSSDPLLPPPIPPDYAWDRAFTGQVLDRETGLMLYRMRFYYAKLGRFAGRDPIEYRSGDANIYRYIFNNSGVKTDPMGMQCRGGVCGSGLSNEQISKCCGDILAVDPQAQTALGFATCCCDVAIICNQASQRYQHFDPDVYYPPMAGSIIEDCVSVHEATHAAEMNCTGRGTSPAIYAFSRSIDCAECDAYKATIKCIEKNRYRCQGDKTCLDALDSFLGDEYDEGSMIYMMNMNCLMCDFKKRHNMDIPPKPPVPPQPTPRPIDPFPQYFSNFAKM